jgi:hypothetical protein
MKFGKRFKITTFLSVIGFTAFAGSAAAVPVVYSGYDAGTTSLATSPNATAAAAAFDLASGPLSIIDFESAIPADVSITGGVGVGDASVVCATPDLHCYATSPTNVYRNNGASFSFATPIDSFGAYFTGWQLSGQTLNIGYMDGSTDVLSMPAGMSSGGTLFFGFIDAGASITSIDYIAGSTDTTDAVGFDDVRYGTAGYTPVPEPTSLVLLGTGLLVAARSRRRRQA